ncbi:hypothetical protein FACS1894158_10260 [Betaproteobacteria bacterium]|nr:hypothetical protein FACS1894158_10260 [Betaproteobacteria bacterium]
MKRFVRAAIVVFVFASAGCATTAHDVRHVYSDNKLFNDAVIDAVFAETDEIKPLVTLVVSDPMTTWKDGRVLLLTYHSYPDSYIASTDYVTKYGEVWTVTDKEILAWFNKNSAKESDLKARFNQLYGFPPEKKYTHFSAMWVNPADVKRPAYQSDTGKQIDELKLPEDVDAEFKKWFDNNIVFSYFDSAYPWTRLGYTYDWAAGSNEYGLSEFLVKKDATVKIEFTKTFDEFVEWLKTQGD